MPEELAVPPLLVRGVRWVGSVESFYDVDGKRMLIARWPSLSPTHECLGVAHSAAANESGDDFAKRVREFADAVAADAELQRMVAAGELNT